MQMTMIGPSGSTSAETMPCPIPNMSEEEFAALASSIAITVLHRPSEGVQAGLMLSTGYWARWGAHVGAPEDAFGGVIEQTRANIARLFLDMCRDNPNVKYHVMIDNDEAVDPSAPFRLAAWDQPIMSGVVCTHHPTRGMFACFTMKDEFGVARFPSLAFTRRMPGRGLVEAHSVGTGLLCVRKDVYERIYAQGWNPFEIPEDVRRASFETGTLKMGEDIAFSKQCEKLEIPRFVDLSVHAVHFKTVPLMWPQGAIDHEMDPRDWKVDSRDYHFG